MKQLTLIATIWTAGFVAGLFAAVSLAQLHASREIKDRPAMRGDAPVIRYDRPRLVLPGDFPNAVETEKGLRVAL